MFPRQITDHPSVNHPLYFPESAFTPAGGAIVYTLYGTGSPRLWTVGFPTGEHKQLTRAVAIDPSSAAKIGGRYGLLRTRGNRSQWRLIPFEPSVIHPQFVPLEPTWIEFAGNPDPRIHRVRRDGTGLECLYGHGNDEFVVHETFPGHTGDLVFTVWPGHFRRKAWTTRAIKTIAGFNAWHITPNRAGTRWAESTYASGSDFEAAATDNLSWMETAADTVYGPRYTHPQPAFSRDEQHIAFTGDRTGFPQIYAVPA